MIAGQSVHMVAVIITRITENVTSIEIRHFFVSVRCYTFEN